MSDTTRVLKELREEKASVEDLVLQGKVHDYSMYRFFIGKIKGLQDAIDIYLNRTKG